MLEAVKWGQNAYSETQYLDVVCSLEEYLSQIFRYDCSEHLSNALPQFALMHALCEF
jgi:hypothetical protein